MSAIPKKSAISVEEYLAGELVSPTKNEYVGGYVYAMAGAKNRHNLIASNAMVSVGSRLRASPCRPFNSDTKIRIRMANQTRFYYPDLSVICRPNSQDESFQDEPKLIVEVLSKKTRRMDEGEKRDAYLAIPSLEFYLLVEQTLPSVALFRRNSDGFVHEVHTGLESTIFLPEIDVELPLNELYEGVVFSDEIEDDETRDE